MTIPEAAAALGLSPITLRRQIGLGSLHAIRHGRDWWVTPAEIERYRAVSLGRPGRHPKTGAQR